MRDALPLRPAAQALVLATVVALVSDAVLGALTGLAAIASAGGAPWWVAGHVVERGRWVAFALLLLMLARRAGPARDEAPWAWRAVGIAVLVAPLLWIAASWLVQAVLYTAAGRWDVDGRIFLEPEFYGRALTGYAPWLAAGAATIAVGRHVG